MKSYKYFSVHLCSSSSGACIYVTVHDARQAAVDITLYTFFSIVVFHIQVRNSGKCLKSDNIILLYFLSKVFIITYSPFEFENARHTMITGFLIVYYARVIQVIILSS